MSNDNNDTFETVEDFLARGGKITRCEPSHGRAPAYNTRRSGPPGANNKRAPRVSSSKAVKTAAPKNSKYEV